MLIMESIIIPNVSLISRHGFLLISFGLLNTSPLGLFILLLLVNIILSTLSHFKANVAHHVITFIYKKKRKKNWIFKLLSKIRFEQNNRPNT